MLTITINPSGAAFEGNAAAELGRIINRAQGKVVMGDVGPGDSAPLRDINGNTCGTVTWVAPEPEPEPEPEPHEHSAEGIAFYAASPGSLREHMREHHGWRDDHPFDAALLGDHGNNVREHLAEHYDQLTARGGQSAPIFEDDDEAAD